MNIKSKDQSHIHTNNIIPYTLGCCVKKLIKNKIGEYEECIQIFSYGTNLNDDEKLYQEHNIHFMNIRDECGLMWPKMNVVTLCGIVVTTFQVTMNDEKTMEDLQLSTTSNRVGLKLIRDLLNMKTYNHFIFYN